jgi:hypothetical protein
MVICAFVTVVFTPYTAAVYAALTLYRPKLVILGLKTLRGISNVPLADVVVLYEEVLNEDPSFVIVITRGKARPLSFVYDIGIEPPYSIEELVIVRPTLNGFQEIATIAV